MSLPLELRRKIYKYFTDALVGGGEGHLDAPQLRNGVRFRQVDRGWNPRPSARRQNYVYDIRIPERPGQRNVDTHGPREGIQRVNILEIYKDIQSGQLVDENTPTGWSASGRRDEHYQMLDGDENATGGQNRCRHTPDDDGDMTDYSDDSWTSENAIMTFATDDGDTDETDTDELADIGQLRLRRLRCTLQIGPLAPSHGCCVHSPHPLRKKDAPAHCCCAGLAFNHAGNYGLKCNDKASPCYFIGEEDCKPLRMLAQVCPQITHKLGQVLWDNSSVEFKGPQSFLDFAAERPAAMPLVRGIVLNVDLNGFPALDTRTEDLERMLAFVSEHCNLRSFAVKLWTEYRAMLSPEDGGNSDARVSDKLIEWAPLFRTLRTSTFDVQHFLLKYSPHADLPEEMWERYIEVVRGTRSQWMPDCMREETAEAAYTRERTEWLGNEQEVSPSIWPFDPLPRRGSEI